MSKRARIDDGPDNLRISKSPKPNPSPTVMPPQQSTDNDANNKFPRWSIGGDDQTEAAATRASPAAGPRGSRSKEARCNRLCQFLERCSFCGNTIDPSRHIFMYMSNPFCRMVCRAKQICIDEIIVNMKKKEEWRRGQYKSG
ncbi:unnamed protein product [Cuscuta campestris]|uniref:FLZ-type domain-containing protein n=1 Tax=Cuscuta campestris TaxID=132261 RepID=A0A484K571_9ASTE|nr:unnamed protein product [Cuscuta campestris]